MDRSGSDTPVLELRAISRTFGEVTALDGLTLDVSRGAVVGLLGHNGAGKTTTIRLLAGLLAPTSGTVRVAGLDPVSDGPEVRGRLGVLPAQPVVDGRMTARDNLRFAADVFGVAADLDRASRRTRVAELVDAALAAFELDDRAEERVQGFSTGMRQRLSLARVLLPDPGILLLDEPTASLDPVAARQVRRLLSDLARDADRTVVICTHDLAEAEQLCDTVVVLEHGRVVAAGSPAELRQAHGSGGLLLTVPPADAATAATVLSAAGPVEVEGAGRLRASALASDAVPELVRALVAADVDVLELRRLDPTLEDVYLALHRDRGAASHAPSGADDATADRAVPR